MDLRWFILSKVWEEMRLEHRQVMRVEESVIGLHHELMG